MKPKKMADAKLTDLPFEVLVKIFHFVIYSKNDMNEYLLPPAERIANGYKPLLLRRQAHRLALRLVCHYFRDTIDSATFWARKTIMAWRKSKGRRVWAYFDKIGIESIIVPSDWLPTSHWRTFLFANLKSLRNLRHVQYSCNFDQNSFELLQNLSTTPLKSVVILDTMPWHINCDHVKGNLTRFLSVLSGFSRSLREITIQACRESQKYGSCHQCYLENIKEVEVCTI